jgi:hypothetical protein
MTSSPLLVTVPPPKRWYRQLGSYLGSGLGLHHPICTSEPGCRPVAKYLAVGALRMRSDRDHLRSQQPERFFTPQLIEARTSDSRDADENDLAGMYISAKTGEVSQPLAHKPMPVVLYFSVPETELHAGAPTRTRTCKTNRRRRRDQSHVMHEFSGHICRYAFARRRVIGQSA